MTKVNHKQMYLLLKQQLKALNAQVSPIVDADKVNEIPDNFNQVGWDSTIEKVEIMLDKLKRLREVKGKRLTPQFYRSIYNRALIACSEADKLTETLSAESTDIDYEAECIKLNAEIYALNMQIFEASKEPEKEPAKVK